MQPVIFNPYVNPREDLLTCAELSARCKWSRTCLYMSIAVRDKGEVEKTSLPFCVTSSKAWFKCMIVIAVWPLCLRCLGMSHLVFAVQVKHEVSLRLCALSAHLASLVRCCRTFPVALSASHMGNTITPLPATDRKCKPWLCFHVPALLCKQVHCQVRKWGFIAVPLK